MLKRYDVLEAHQGDRAYAAGDTRIAEETSVAHLLPLHMLREATDQSGINSPTVAETPETLVVTLTAERTAMIERLKATETERDEARDQVKAAEGARDDARVDAAAYPALMEAARADVAAAVKRAEDAERDLAAARADADSAATERDVLRAEVEQLKAAAKPTTRK